MEETIHFYILQHYFNNIRYSAKDYVIFQKVGIAGSMRLMIRLEGLKSIKNWSRNLVPTPYIVS